MLPENKPTQFDKTPTKFFVWGASMTGKTYFARQFPNPILLNTDGNAKKVDTPSIEIKSFEQFCKVIDELEAGNHTFETIVIDLIDDIELMMINHICAINKKEALADIPFGKGFSIANSTWKNLLMNLAKSRYNIVFISHLVETLDDGNQIQKPSLSSKSLNVCLGRCDLQIQTLKLGNNYNKIVTTKRDNYVAGDIKNPVILKALENTMGLFERKN